MTIHRACIIAVAAALLGVSVVFSDRRLYAHQTLDELRALAQRGHADAQGELELLVPFGQGVPEDDGAPVWQSRFVAEYSSNQ